MQFFKKKFFNILIFFKIIIRNILRYKVYSFVNILGLSIGITSFILIFLFVVNEINFDRFNKKYKRIFRVEHKEWAMLGTIYSDLIKETFPKIVENSVRIDILFGETGIVSYKNKIIRLNNLILSENSLFDIFTLPFIKGNKNKALKDPYSIILTESLSKKIFANENPMGKIIKYDDKLEFTVTGIIKDVKNSHIQIQAIAPFILLKKFTNYDKFLEMYDSWNYYTFLILKNKNQKKELENKINLFFDGIAMWKDKKPEFHLRALKDIYFSNNITFEKACLHNDGIFIYVFVLIAIFILIIASINFINLTNARASIRLKEIAIKKVFGASKKNLIFQFLSEAILITFFASFLAISTTEILLPYFNDFFQKNINLTLINQFVSWSSFFLGIILLGILSGIYPAFYLSSFKIISILKNEFKTLKSTNLFRKILIIFQFSISIILIISTLFVFKQLNFLKNKSLGFDKNHILTLNLSRDIFFKKKLLKEKILSSIYVESISFSNQIQSEIIWQENWQINKKECSFSFFPIDPSYINVAGIKLKAGRNFDENNIFDEINMEKKQRYSCILNETALKSFGFKENPIGKKIPSYWGEAEIIGVVKDFNFNSLHQKISPLMMVWCDKWLSKANIKIKSKYVKKSIFYVKKVWEDISKKFPFEHKFLDKEYYKKYQNEERLGKIFAWFSFLAILIASMGLLALSVFMIERRRKEIGIRRVMGASIFDLFILISKDFAKLILYSNIISITVSYFFVKTWLSNFAYSTNIDINIFLVGTILSFFIAFFTIFIYIFNISKQNLIENLNINNK